MANTLQRRASDEKRNTYWLEYQGDGFARVHTCAVGTRQVDPKLRHLAAMVERAPELVEALAAVLEVVALKCPTALSQMPECVDAQTLLSDIAVCDPARQAVKP